MKDAIKEFLIWHQETILHLKHGAILEQIVYSPSPAEFFKIHLDKALSNLSSFEVSSGC